MKRKTNALDEVRWIERIAEGRPDTIVRYEIADSYPANIDPV